MHLSLSVEKLVEKAIDDYNKADPHHIVKLDKIDTNQTRCISITINGVTALTQSQLDGKCHDEQGDLMRRVIARLLINGIAYHVSAHEKQIKKYARIMRQ